MDHQDLPGTVIFFVVLGLLIGVGVLTILALGDAARDTLTLTEALNITSASGATLTNQQVKEITSVSNATNTFTTPEHYNATITDTTTTIVVGAGMDDDYFNITYSYYSDTSATTQMDNVNTAIASIPSTWLGLIITIMALAIILGLVIRSFTGSR